MFYSLPSPPPLRCVDVGGVQRGAPALWGPLQRGGGGVPERGPPAAQASPDPQCCAPAHGVVLEGGGWPCLAIRPETCHPTWWRFHVSSYFLFDIFDLFDLSIWSISKQTLFQWYCHKCVKRPVEYTQKVLLKQLCKSVRLSLYPCRNRKTGHPSPSCCMSWLPSQISDPYPGQPVHTHTPVE